MILATFLIVYFTVEVGWYAGFLVSLVPLWLYYLIFTIEHPKWILISLFILNYYILAFSRYIDNFQGGILMDAFFFFAIFLIFATSPRKYHYPWNRLLNVLTFCTFAWVIFCVFQLFNPELVSFSAWIQGVRGIAIYFFLVIILAQLLFTDFNDLRVVAIVWSVLVLTAIAKAIFQKYVGFDTAELRWLFTEGYASTHIIHTGTRYFSYFTDAANFGAAMAFAMVFFLLIASVQKSKPMKIYFFVVGLLSAYAMLISGTRVAIFIPFFGFAIYALLMRNTRVVSIFTILLVVMFVFFKYTMLLQGNQTIRRMRSAFNPQLDASFQLRLANQQKMKTYMAHRFFGIGIGMSGRKGQQNAPDAFMSQIPTDSWFVLIWVQTGLAGLILHIFTLIIIMGYGAYIIMFKVKTRELKVYLAAFHGGIIGMIVASYGNEIFGQFPNGFTIYLGMAFIYLGPYYDKELLAKKSDDTQLLANSLPVKQIQAHENK
ncbi:MAG: O-antigen ligase family protein [Bacteroidales bacterium]